jgi:hypothetical protein
MSKITQSRSRTPWRKCQTAFALGLTVKSCIWPFQPVLEVIDRNRDSDVQSHSRAESSEPPWSTKTGSRRGLRARSSEVYPDSSHLLIQMIRLGWQIFSSSGNQSRVNTTYQIQQSSGPPPTESHP